VIAMNSFVAFGATVGSVALDGHVVDAVLAAAIRRERAGRQAGGACPPIRLRRWFGGFVLATTVVILGA
jgi:hypothetical protein